MDSDTSESNLVIVTNKDRFIRFLKIYRKTILIIVVPLVLMPVTVIGQNNAYSSFYTFLITAIFFVGDFLHPSVTSFLPLALFTIMGTFNMKMINAIILNSSVLDCLGVMIIILAVEESHLHKRVALKILLIFGCSHFRLCFILFTTTMVLSMCLTNCMACGLMMPLVKAILKELEKMGLIEIYDIISKVKSNTNEKYVPRPSDFTIFYFIGIAYSSSIGGMATYIGSETNQLFMHCCAVIFPDGPKLEFPHYLLLTLPGVLIMEMFLYLWLNFYFLGMLRVQNYTALQATLSSEEEQFISVLLTAQYQQMGKMRFQEMVVGATVVLAAALQVLIIMCSYQSNNENFDTKGNLNISVPSMICVIILFLTPINLDCLKFFSRPNDNLETLPLTASRGCLTWTVVKNNLDWNVLFVTASANITFESMKDCKMTDEFEKFLSLFSNCPPPALACIVTLFCKILTEFASNSTVAQSLLLHIANVGVTSKATPLYLMLSATLSTSLPFHLITGTPANAMVASYVHIPSRKMMITGIGPSVIAILTNLFTVCVWSKIIWPDIDTYHK